MENERRIKKVGISFPLLMEMIRQDYRIEKGVACVQGIPIDAVIVNSYTDLDRAVGYLIVYHPSFDIVPMGDAIPEIGITHRLFGKDVS